MCTLKTTVASGNSLKWWGPLGLCLWSEYKLLHYSFVSEFGKPKTCLDTASRTLSTVWTQMVVAVICFAVEFCSRSIFGGFSPSNAHSIWTLWQILKRFSFFFPLAAHREMFHTVQSALFSTSFSFSLSFPVDLYLLLLFLPIPSPLLCLPCLIHLLPLTDQCSLSIHLGISVSLRIVETAPRKIWGPTRV